MSPQTTLFEKNRDFFPKNNFGRGYNFCHSFLCLFLLSFRFFFWFFLFLMNFNIVPFSFNFAFLNYFFIAFFAFLSVSFLLYFYMVFVSSFRLSITHSSLSLFSIRSPLTIFCNFSFSIPFLSFLFSLYFFFSFFLFSPLSIVSFYFPFLVPPPNPFTFLDFFVLLLLPHLLFTTVLFRILHYLLFPLFAIILLFSSIARFC